jgi:type III pantothenate kinase
MIGPMLLVVDVGNTQTHFGTFRDGELVEHWRFATERTSTADELGAAFASLLELRGLGFDDLTASIISTVVPELEPEYEGMVAQYLGHRALFVGPGLKTGMPIQIDNPRELGADRLVNAIAGYERFHTACVVVDFGTSINYDVVSAAGEFLGGIIAPGVEISLDALHQRAAKLVRVDLEKPRGVIGKSTIDSVRSGVVYGFAGQVDGIVERVRAELGEDTRAIATGGLAEFIVPYCDSIDEVDDMLTLTGLRILYERNS